MIVNLAILAAPTSKKAYLKREWLNNKHLWANYARQHSCLLLQNMTTNAVESWHSSLKTHAEVYNIFNNCMFFTN